MADGRVGPIVQIENHLKFITRRRGGNQGGGTIGDFHGFADAEKLFFGGLLDDAGILQCLNKGQAGTIHTGNLSTGDIDLNIVQAQAVNGGHAMFNGFDGVGTVADGAAAGAFGDLLNQCGNAHGPIQITADEYHPMARRRGFECERRGFTGK